jgi:hypothetical protein
MLTIQQILEGAPIGVPVVEKPSLTVPMSPAIQKPKPPPQRPPSPPKVIKANPIRLPEKPFQPVIEHREILPAHFALPGDEISERKRREFEEELRKKAEVEDRMRHFVARPIMDIPPQVKTQCYFFFFRKFLGLHYLCIWLDEFCAKIMIFYNACTSCNTGFPCSSFIYVNVFYRMKMKK